MLSIHQQMTTLLRNILQGLIVGKSWQGLATTYPRKILKHLPEQSSPWKMEAMTVKATISHSAWLKNEALRRAPRSSQLLRANGFELRPGRTIYLNTPWFGFLRNDAEQVDAQQAVGQRRDLHLDVIRQPERQPKCPLGNALVEVRHFLICLAFPAGLHTSIRAS